MGQQSINIDNSSALPIPMYSLMNPTYKGVYVFSISDVAGVVAANNFLTLFNPVASGKTLIYGGTFISSYSVAAITLTANSMRGFRVTAASAGSLQAASAISKFQTVFPNPAAEVRIGNPTVTATSAISSSPVQVGNGVTGAVHAVLAPPGSGAFTMAEGEGLVVQTASGDVDTRWNLSIVWAEA
jgi:hypothetical protein